MNKEIIHINDCAGVTFLIPERGKTFRRYKPLYKFDEVYSYTIVNYPVKIWLMYLFFYVLLKRPKQVWFHSALLEFKHLIRFNRIFKTRFVYWSHGSDLRDKNIPEYIFKADKLFKSTNSVMDSRFEKRRVPIDTKLFFPGPKIKNSALCIAYNRGKYRTKVKNVQRTADYYNMNLEIIHNGDLNYLQLAKKLRVTEFYFESKGLFPEQSKTLYEAKASGCLIIEENKLLS